LSDLIGRTECLFFIGTVKGYFNHAGYPVNALS
jgi:hypothetical protein